MHATYLQSRERIETYFDRTAAAAWARLTSDAPVSGIRATVRAGRDRMRGLFLDALPADLRGRRVLDAGCGTGALALELARRGADVLAIDLSPTLVRLAEERTRGEPLAGRLAFASGDMLDAGLGGFDHVVAMDSLIHYRRDDAVRALAALAGRTKRSLVFTFAPRTPLLATMIGIGRLFPRGDRAPFIEPVGEVPLRAALAAAPALAGWRVQGSERVRSGFYISQVMELVRA